MSAPSPAKTTRGNFFEDFQLGQTIRHATPRTVTLGDVALYNGLFGVRFAVQSADVFAQKIGYPCSPLDDLLVFHIVFGKTVTDISPMRLPISVTRTAGFSNPSSPAPH